MLPWSAAAQAQITAGQVRAGLFLRVQCSDEAVRLWGGVGDFAYGPDLIETAAEAIYNGFGVLNDLPAVQSLINGEAERVDFKMSGAWVTPDILSLGSYHAAAIRNAPCSLGLLVLGPDWQPFADSPMAWLWFGLADTLTVERDDSGGQVVRGLSLSVGSIMTGRRRPTLETWTDYNQERDHPGDTFCQYVMNYNAGSTRVWPR